VRNEIARMRRQLLAQEQEIWMLRRAGASTASAELLLTKDAGEGRCLLPRARDAAKARG
jgi:hypothetical protein